MRFTLAAICTSVGMRVSTSEPGAMVAQKMVDNSFCVVDLSQSQVHSDLGFIGDCHSEEGAEPEGEVFLTKSSFR